MSDKRPASAMLPSGLSRAKSLVRNQPSGVMASLVASGWFQ